MGNERILLFSVCFAGDMMNRFMSDNWQVVYQELKPVVDQAVASLVGDVVKKIFKRFPIDELLPQ